MKNQTLALAAALMLAFGVDASAQSLKLDSQDPQPVKATPGGGTATTHAQLRNVGSGTVPVNFRADLSRVVDGHNVSICFGDLCYFVFPDDNPADRDGFDVLPDGTTDLKAQLSPGGIEGTSTITYTLFNNGNPGDSLQYTVTFVIGNATSVREIGEASGVRVGPNPATGIVTIQGDIISTVIGVDIYDAQGSIVRSVMPSRTSTLTLPVNGLAAGSYQVILTTDKDVFRAPITVVH